MKVQSVAVGTPEWHWRRTFTVGASDVGVITTDAPYRGASQRQLAREKRGQMRGPSPTVSNSIAASVLEKAGREWLREALQTEVQQSERDAFITRCTACCKMCTVFDDQTASPCCAACSDVCHGHANLDGRVLWETKTCVYEHKLVTRFNPEYQSWAGQQCPLAVQQQVQWQMWCAGLSGAVVVVFRDDHWSTRVVSADEAMQEALRRTVATWWARVVVGGGEPDTTDKDLEHLRVWHAHASLTPEIMAASPEFEDLVQEYQQQCQIVGPAKRRAGALKVQILEAMKEHREARTATGLCVTHCQQTQAHWRAVAEMLAYSAGMYATAAQAVGAVPLELPTTVQEASAMTPPIRKSRLHISRRESNV